MCDMEKAVFLLSMFAVTVYLAVTAWEDYKTCEVTRWKHLIGGIPAIFSYILQSPHYHSQENAIILAFSFVCILVGKLGIYGFADGLVLAVLTLFFGSLGGVAGSGVVLVIMIIASLSFLFTHLAGNLLTKRKIFQNMAGAFIPHIFLGYGVVCAFVCAGL